ncbi:hypothetical protein L873DRAFT_1849586 [Choiromyces venosus 120613-1]|uniref:DDE-1 domain-containing protein n=1 Tax=Choiromyces venosus 120613-1 TaxID=1336337 RepID=A0A3N4IU16_9PEZI|nr:hypothetical protein L873DRAFT_1849586 [Choiromyces venosus 120613-1]
MAEITEITHQRLKKQLNQALEWLQEDPSRTTNVAATQFQVNSSSLQMCQLHYWHQQRNSCGTFNEHGGNNIILTTAQEKALHLYCYEQWEMGIGATPSIIYAAICHLKQQEKCSQPSISWFHKWLKKNSALHMIQTKPIGTARITTHTEEDLKMFFTNYQEILDRYGIHCARYIYNMDESEVRIGCPIGEIIVVPTEVKELYTASPENWKSLTIIEAIYADGTPSPTPVIICPGEKIIESWIHENLTGAEVITVSPTGYTNENITLAWLDHFIKHIEAGSDKHWHILLVDGYISHHQDDFIIKCHENHIVPFEFPSRLTHVLQPLDVGVFRP